MSIKAIMLTVRVFNPVNDEIEDERTVDHADKMARIWLGKHLFWAIRNGYGVEIEPLVQGGAA